MKDYYESVQEFHQFFDPVDIKGVKRLSGETAKNRAGFKIEEIVEFLYAAREGDTELVTQDLNYLKIKLDESLQKIDSKKQGQVDPLIDEVDGLIDLLYFTFGSFVMMGIDPEPLFNIVHQANMGKIFPDGEPHYHEITGKVLKPDNWEKDFAPEAKLKTEIEKQRQRQ